MAECCFRLDAVVSAAAPRTLARDEQLTVGARLLLVVEAVA
jgi:hypothetical protein